LDNPRQSFLARHEFLIRRLHSLSGLVPVGAYMVIHLLTNASVLDSPGTFQRNVNQIHSLGSALWIVEWGFIFLPLLFHAIFGVVIVRGGLPNVSSYPLAGNVRYSLQRASGMIAFFFIMWHVFHMHGWFHFDSYLRGVAEPLGGAQFRPYNAASSAAHALRHWSVQVLYAIGVLACVFHLANGIWTMGITWGVWVSPAAQRRANYISIAVGVVLSVVGLSALVGMTQVDVEKARAAEDLIYEGASLGKSEEEKERDRHKRYHAPESSAAESSAAPPAHASAPH
jgi:succinate dehydrogenase / fumarate reductase, cytochrome b subunit